MRRQRIAAAPQRAAHARPVACRAAPPCEALSLVPPTCVPPHSLHPCHAHGILPCRAPQPLPLTLKPLTEVCGEPWAANKAKRTRPIDTRMVCCECQAFLFHLQAPPPALELLLCCKPHLSRARHKSAPGARGLPATPKPAARPITRLIHTLGLGFQVTRSSLPRARAPVQPMPAFTQAEGLRARASSRAQARSFCCCRWAPRAAAPPAV